MRDSRHKSFDTVLTGAIAGLATCTVYPLLIAAPLPDLAAAVLAAAMGPLLGVGSWGLREFLNLHRRGLITDLGAASNAIAGALVSSMLLVQLAVDERTGDNPSPEAKAVWLGLDVAWDMYIGLGTLLFAIAAWTHPRFGRLFGGAGVLIAIALLSLNLYSFPTPPADDGLVDVGPLVGLWYLAVTVMMFRSLRWVRALDAQEADGSALPAPGPASN